jgi:quinol monooxygenase YgiN
MILVTVTVHFRPDKRDQAIAAALAAREQTLKEDGCISYRFFTSADDPNAGLLLEHWRDAAALDAHMAQPHVAELGQAMGDFVDAPVDIQRYEVPDPA